MTGANLADRYLLFNDFTNISQGTPQLNANLTKHNGSSYAGGALWTDSVNQYVYQFGGEAMSNWDWNNGKQQTYQSPQGEFSVYDSFLNQWNSSRIMHRTSPTAWGASASVDERGEGYSFGGWINNLTNPEATGQIASPSLIQFNMSNHRFKNFTGPDSIGKAEGALIFLPASDAGVLVYFGGVQDPTNNGIGIGYAMDTINIYDIQSGQWYNQTASGNIPDMRRRFCAGATWSDDYSSYNIYVYGGLSAMPQPPVEAYDDVYILSLPSFVWLKWWQPKSATMRPRHSMTCTVVNRSQMIVVGGTFPYDQDCDSPQAWGTHTINLSSISSNSSEFSNFVPKNTYSVPPELIAVIGGGPKGGATVKSPQTWSAPELSTIFSKVASFPPRAPTRSFKSRNAKSRFTTAQKAGIISGSAIGGVLLICTIVPLIICKRTGLSKQKVNMIELPASRTPDVSAVPIPHGSSSDMEQKSAHSAQGESSTPVPSCRPLLEYTSAVTQSEPSERPFSAPNHGRRLSTRSFIAYLYRSGYSTDQVRQILMQNYQQSQARAASPVAESGRDKEEDGAFEHLYPPPLNVSKRSVSCTGP